jgi:hypothetical protein
MPPCGVWKVTSVPADQVDLVVAQFQLDDPIRVETKDNHDGTFDVIATFPPCPDGGAQGTT